MRFPYFKKNIDFKDCARPSSGYESGNATETAPVGAVEAANHVFLANSAE